MIYGLLKMVVKLDIYLKKLLCEFILYYNEMFFYKIFMFLNILVLVKNHLTIAAEWKNPVDISIIYFVDNE